MALISPPWLLLLLLFVPVASSSAKGLYDLAAIDIDGNVVSLSQYEGTVSVVINVASFCGLTDRNYRELRQLQTRFASRGFQVLAFPCNQFNQQEPKSNAEIKEFALSKYSANFPLFAKTTVNPPMCEGHAASCSASSADCCPTNNIVYEYLKGVFPGPIEWNFAKFLIGRDGIPIKRYEPSTNPMSLIWDIESALSVARDVAVN